ncbi:hypothetical protein [Arenibacter certesii]|uniref:Uncharacterized protein n=1 Tax=Arenibacter certesii TaxID=228955 RepID=A0A918ISQ9_9FLAO|nr:hypothetical protein [Arenibacter certesii]GGW28695.1 hypothetical protein GCM10007383_12630 [Arenibacter certesii]
MKNKVVGETPVLKRLKTKIMYQLNYHSISKPDLNFEDLDNILEKAISVNSEKNKDG